MTTTTKQTVKSVKRNIRQTDIKSNGTVFYDGPSLLNGDPIIGIITGVTTPSKNPKTGDMLQVWVLPKDQHPNNIKDMSGTHPTCGDCPLKSGICYVNAMSYGQVYKAYKEDRYPELSEKHLQLFDSRKRAIRLCAYGEATAIPLDIWMPILRACYGFTGYTHTWVNCDQEWQKYLMASVETDHLAKKAASMGWRYFKIVSENDSINDNEIICPNYLDPQKHQCETCQLCNGSNSEVYSDKPHIITPVHGSGLRIPRFLEKYNKL